MHNKLYFVFAMPRSRTTWLANLLTHGQSRCLHCLGPEAQDADGITRKLRSLPYPFAGATDPILLSNWRQLLADHPHAPVVIVRRDISDVMVSWFNATAKRPDLRTYQVRRVIEGLFEQMEALEQRVCELRRQCMVVRFQDLASPKMVRLIWHYCGMEEPFDLDRCEELEGMRVEAKFDEREMMDRYERKG